MYHFPDAATVLKGGSSLHIAAQREACILSLMRDRLMLQLSQGGLLRCLQAEKPTVWMAGCALCLLTTFYYELRDMKSG